jgi:hypothetical protein
MGYVKHDAVIATVGDSRIVERVATEVAQFRNKLSAEWARLVIGPVAAVVNGDQSYVFLPDGSKTGFAQDELGDDLRDEFVSLFHNVSCDVVTLRYGGDDAEVTATASCNCGDC